jgi:hypothetical protein
MPPDDITLYFCFGHMTVPIGLIYVDPLTRSLFSWTHWISKSFKLPNFSAPQSRGQIARVVEIERHLFLGKQITALSPNMHIKLDVVVHAKSYHFSLLPSRLLLLIHYLLHRTSSHYVMTGETS